MCESVKKFGSKRPGRFSGRCDSLPPAQYSLSINMLNTGTSGYLLSKDSIKLLPELRDYHDVTANFERRLENEIVLNDHSIFSNILNTSKPILAAIIKRNKSDHKSVNIGNRISFSQVL